MNPLVIATPRSGCTIMSEFLGNLSEQLWGGRGSIGEVFNIHAHISLQEKDNGLVLIKGKSHWSDPALNEEKIKRRKLLDSYPGYTITLFPSQIEPWMPIWIKTKGYKVIFIERRNKIKQLASYLAAKQREQWVYHKWNSYDLVDSVRYNEGHAMNLIKLLQTLQSLKKEFENSITLYYEDWISEGGNMRALAKLLGVVDNFKEKGTSLIQTPYSMDSSLLLELDPNWQADKNRIIKLFAEI